MAILSRLFLASLCCLMAFAVLAADDGNDNTGRDDAQVYHLYADVDLVTTLKLQYGKNPKLFVKSVYPQLEGDVDNEAILKFNELVTDLVKQEIDLFKSNVKQNEAMLKGAPPKVRNNLYLDYDTSFIKSNTDHIISIRFSMQEYLTGMAHPFHHHRVLNYNLDTAQSIELEEIFIPGSNYLQVLSDYTRKILMRRLDNRKMVLEGTTPTAEHFKRWNIKPNGLLFTFAEYQVAPYIYGAQTVLVPYSELEDILSPDSVIAGCVKQRKKCARNNLLTGGFIDEAVNTRHRPLNPILSKL